METEIKCGDLLIGTSEFGERHIGYFEAYNSVEKDGFPFRLENLPFGLKNCVAINWFGTLPSSTTLKEIFGIDNLPNLPRDLDVYTEKITEMLESRLNGIPFRDDTHKLCDDISDLIKYWRSL